MNSYMRRFIYVLAYAKAYITLPFTVIETSWIPVRLMRMQYRVIAPAWVCVVLIKLMEDTALVKPNTLQHRFLRFVFSKTGARIEAQAL